MSDLGILVKSGTKADWIFNLARAAGTRKKSVWIHFAENGILGLHEQQIEKLKPYARISICRSSADRLGLVQNVSRRFSSCLVPPTAAADMIRSCERYVVL